MSRPDAWLVRGILDDEECDSSECGEADAEFADILPSHRSLELKLMPVTINDSALGCGALGCGALGCGLIVGHSNGVNVSGVKWQDVVVV